MLEFGVPACHLFPQAAAAAAVPAVGMSPHATISAGCPQCKHLPRASLLSLEPTTLVSLIVRSLVVPVLVINRWPGASLGSSHQK